MNMKQQVRCRLDIEDKINEYLNEARSLDNLGDRVNTLLEIIAIAQHEIKASKNLSQSTKRFNNYD